MGGAGGGSVLGRLPAVVYCELLGGEPRRLGVEPRARLRDPQHARARRGVAARQYGAQRGAVHAAQREERGGERVGVHDAEQLRGGGRGDLGRGVLVEHLGAREQAAVVRGVVRGAGLAEQQRQRPVGLRAEREQPAQRLQPRRAPGGACFGLGC